ncbi:MAG: long-chain N-acyl amino acid synthase [Nitrosomonas sp.]|nr:long-chain N-acyl amino acid synthase [Nitrosomonas sp.]
MQTATSHLVENPIKTLYPTQNAYPENPLPTHHKLPQHQYRFSGNPNNKPKPLSPTEATCLLQTADFSIHLVNSFKQRVKASTLIKRMYAARGYQTENTSVFSESSNQYTFEARNTEQLLGTLTLTIDSDNGLLADQLYRNEINAFRKEGKTVCEVSKLAFTPNTSSKSIFSALFHVAYLHARFLHDVEAAFIEINPRHVRFYKNTLGFTQIGEQRTCPRVDAPAILLSLDLNHMGDQILQHVDAALPESKERSIYSYFFSSRIANQVFNKIIQIHSATRPSHNETRHPARTFQTRSKWD